MAGVASGCPFRHDVDGNDLRRFAAPGLGVMHCACRHLIGLADLDDLLGLTLDQKNKLALRHRAFLGTWVAVAADVHAGRNFRDAQHHLQVGARDVGLLQDGTLDRRRRRLLRMQRAAEGEDRQGGGDDDFPELFLSR